VLTGVAILGLWTIRTYSYRFCQPTADTQMCTCYLVLTYNRYCVARTKRHISWSISNGMANLPAESILSHSSWIFVSGVNGLVGSHVADQCLRMGLCVRGTVRDVNKAQWMNVLFEQKYGRDRFQLVEVKRLDDAELVCNAMKGNCASSMLYRPKHSCFE
jgi:hypothetical protein